MLSKAEAIEIINKGSDDTKFVVRTNAEDEAFQQNRENHIIGKRIGELHSQYDADIFETTGIEKNQGEKTYDYNKRVLSSLKAKAEGGGDQKLKDKIAELQAAVDNKDSDVTKAELAGLKSALKEAQDKLRDTIDAKDNELHSLMVRNEINNAKATMKFKSDIPETASKALINLVVNEITETGKVTDDGGIAFFDEDGNILLDKRTGAPLGASAILTDRLDSILDKGRKQEGTGGKNEKGVADGKEPLPAEVKTPNDLTKWLADSGHSQGSKEYQELYDTYREQI